MGRKRAELGEAHRQLLLEIRRREAALRRRREPEWPHGSFRERVLMGGAILEREEQQKFGPRFSSSEWFGASTLAERKRFSRAISRLEADGLIRATTGPAGRAVEWLRLTREGRRVARGLSGGAKESKRAP